MSLSFIGAAYAAGGAGQAGGSFPPFETSNYPGQLFWLAVSFGLVYVLMSRVAIPRIAGIIEERRARIESDLAKAAEAQKAAEDAAKAFEANLVKAKGNAQGIGQAARDSAAKAAEARRHEVEAELATKLAGAEKTIGETKAKAMASVEAIATEAAEAIVHQLTGAAPKAGAIAGAISALGKK